MHFTSSHTCYLTFPSYYSWCVEPSNICLVLIMKFLVMEVVHVSYYTLFLPRTPCWKTTPFLMSATSYSAYWQTLRISGGRILLIVVTWIQSLNVIQVYFSSYEVKYLVLWERKHKTVRLWVHFPHFIIIFFVVTPYIRRLNIRRIFPPPSSGPFNRLLPECRTSHSKKLTYCHSTPRNPSGLKFRILYQALLLNVHPSGLFSVWQIFLRTAHTLQGKRSNTKSEKR